MLACLIQLNSPEYGYGLLESLTAVGIETDGNTLYPLLRRLEKQGLLVSEWDTKQQRPRKFYQVTPAGQQAKVRLLSEWEKITATFDRLTSEDNTPNDDDEGIQ